MSNTLLGNPHCTHDLESNSLSQRQRVQFRTSIPPGRIVLGQQRYEPLIVRRFDQMDHFMHDHIFKQVTRLLGQFRVEPNVSLTMIATTPFGFHSLQEVTIDLHADPWLPVFDQRGNGLM